MWRNFDIDSYINITSNTGVNFCKKFEVFNNFHQVSNSDWITSVRACMSDCKCSFRTSFTHTNTRNPYWNKYLCWWWCECNPRRSASDREHLADHTAACSAVWSAIGIILSWCALWLITIHPTTKVYEQVNRKGPLGTPFYNFQLPTPTLSRQTPNLSLTPQPLVPSGEHIKTYLAICYLFTFLLLMAPITASK